MFGTIYIKQRIYISRRRTQKRTFGKSRVWRYVISLLRGIPLCFCSTWIKPAQYWNYSKWHSTYWLKFVSSEHILDCRVAVIIYSMTVLNFSFYIILNSCNTLLIQKISAVLNLWFSYILAPFDVLQIEICTRIKNGFKYNHKYISF